MPRHHRTFASWAWLLALASVLYAWGGPARAQTAASPALRRAPTVVVITLRGEIDGRGIMARSVERRIALAERARADAIVLEIDTPGGSVDSVLRICKAIKGSRIRNTVAWINKDAYSGGAVVALACREIVINDPASFGDAMPIGLAPGGLGATEVPPELLKKILPPLVAEVTESVRRHNEEVGAYEWDEYLAKAIVINDMELWAVRHKATGRVACIDRAEFAQMFPDANAGGTTRLASIPVRTPAGPVKEGAGSAKLALIAQAAEARTDMTLTSKRPRFTAADAADWELADKVLDGSAPALLRGDDMIYFGIAANVRETVGGRERFVPVRGDEDLKEFFQAKRLVRYEPNWSEGLVLAMTHNAVRFVLVVIFLVAMFIEMTHPGAAFPAAVAVLALVGLVAPPMLVGMASWWGVAAIIAGVGLLALEVFVVPGFGAAGVSGLILLFLGFVGVFVPRGTGLIPATAEARVDLLYICMTVLLAMFTAGVGIFLIARHLRSIPGLSRLVLRSTSGEEMPVTLLQAMDDEAPPVRVGATGTAITPMRPAGRVEIDGRVVDAVAEFGFIDAGAAVRVSSVDGVRIGVEPVGGGARNG